MRTLSKTLLICIYFHFSWANDFVLLDYGCWRDTSDRAIPSIDSRLHGNYKTRTDAIQECAHAAKVLGYTVFAVQDGGWCASGPRAKYTYKKYGASDKCESNGKGGPWANQVYEIDTVLKVNYMPVGCFKDTSNRAIPTVEKRFILLHDNYQQRPDALGKCARIAASLGNNVFALQNGGWCATSSSASSTYKKYGFSQDCNDDGEGGPWANDVYKITSIETISLTRLGCFADTEDRALPFIERPEVLQGQYKTRPQAIEQCVRYASGLGHTYVGMQDGGSCMAGVNYSKYGTSTKCKPDSKGGPWANEVFKIRSVRKEISLSSLKNYQEQYYLNSLGCWTDNEQRALPVSLESSPVLIGEYRSRKDAIQRCAQAASDRGYKIIGVQNGGQCWSGQNARKLYRKFGSSNKCRNGKGGAWANDVYEINIIWNPLVTGLGCYKDTSNRAMTVIENINPSVTGDYRSRTDAVRKCARVVDSLNYNVFGVQNGGQCCSSANAALTYKKFGRADNCGSGKGGPWSNSVYRITDSDDFHIKSLGCWADDAFRTIPIVETEGPEFQAQPSYQAREDAFGKCARYAHTHDFKIFAVQNGGQCFTSTATNSNYQRIGPSEKCRKDSKGGPWANQVFAIISD